MVDEKLAQAVMCQGQCVNNLWSPDLKFTTFRIINYTSNISLLTFTGHQTFLVNTAKRQKASIEKVIENNYRTPLVTMKTDKSRKISAFLAAYQQSLHINVSKTSQK